MANVSQDPTHTYLDINICNNNISVDNTNPQQIVFNSKRDADYITDPSAYYVSVIRWSLDCSLPICIPQIDLNYNNGLYDPAIGGFKTIYSFTLQIKKDVGGGVIHIAESDQMFVNLVPQHYNIPPPQMPVTSMSNVYDNRYFYIESVQYLLLLVNDALTRAWVDVKAKWLANVSWGALPIVDVAPFILYNFDGNFTFNASPDFLESVDLTLGRGQIFMNSPLYTLFNGFSSIVVGYDPTSPQDITNGKNNYIQFISEYQTTTFNNIDYVFMLTEYPTVPFMSPISSIVFTTQGIPVEPTNVTPTNIFGSPTNLGSTNNNNNLSPIITDFHITLNTGIEGRTITYYATQGEYRFFDLNSNRPLSDINIVCMWKDKLTGSTHPMYLRSGGAGTLKLLFRKKTFYNNNSI
jgi:hypothetical protein